MFIYAIRDRKSWFLLLMWKTIQNENGGSNIFVARGAFFWEMCSYPQRMQEKIIEKSTDPVIAFHF